MSRTPTPRSEPIARRSAVGPGARAQDFESLIAPCCFPIAPCAKEEPRMTRLLSAIALIFTTTPALADLMMVELVKKENTVEVKIGNRDFTTLHLEKSQAKPYFSPVLAADGAQISRPLENPEDHPHHKGIWCSIDEVNDIKYWAEKGKIENQSVELSPAT